MEENTIREESDIQGEDVELMQTVDEEGNPVDLNPELIAESDVAAEPTLEDMKKDPQYIKSIHNLAAKLQAEFPNKWISYPRYFKKYKGTPKEMFLTLMNTLREFNVAVVKDYNGELRMKIDFTKEVELELIQDDIKYHEGRVKALKERAKVVKKMVNKIKKENESSRKD